MKKAEIDRFVKNHTQTFQLEILQKSKKRVSYPNTAYKRTAQINLQRRCDFNQHKVIQEKWQNLADYLVHSMDNGEKITLVKILDLAERLIHELEIDSLPQMAMTNVVAEIVEKYHLFFGIKARTCIQLLVYAIADVPGDTLVLNRLRTDITTRLERDHMKTGGLFHTMNYELPLDEAHLDRNPPMRRCSTKSSTNTATQTAGTFNEKPVMALIMEK